MTTLRVATSLTQSATTVATKMLDKSMSHVCVVMIEQIVRSEISYLKVVFVWWEHFYGVDFVRTPR